MKKLFYCLLMWSFIQVDAQQYPVSAINDSLIQNADVVVRHSENVFIQTDINNATDRVVEVTTILKKDGKDHGNFVAYLDKFRDLKSFSGTVIDASGKVIKKIAKKDLFVTEYSSDIASDNKYVYYEYKPISYPYTICYEYEIRIKDGVPSYPKFIPVSGYNVSVEHAKYQIQVPKDFDVRYKAERMPNEKPVLSIVGNSVTYDWSVDNVPAIEYEPYSPGLSAIMPVVQFAPNDFCMGGRCGNMSDWNSLGKWLGGLMEGRSEISPQLKEKLLNLTSDAETDKEKVQRVYKYLQSTTRYVSIQLGIGGFQPMSAADVEKTGFGDCKALSNYMYSMLNAIGISSIYTAISVDRANLYTDFASLGQMNHVILAVPMDTDTLWLECTTQDLPFNYPHTGIAGHQCLLIKNQGGELCRVKRLSDIDNLRTRSIIAEVDESGNGKALIKTAYKLNAYEEMQSFIHSMSREEQINSLTRGLQVSKAKISELQILPYDDEDPDLQIAYNANIEKFANKLGNRLFVPFAILKPNFVVMNTNKRKQDIVLSNGILRTDTLSIAIPTGYAPETIPKSVTIDSVFGSYSIDTQLDGNNIKITQNILLKKGHYPASIAEEFNVFFKNMEKESARSAVFKQL